MLKPIPLTTFKNIVAITTAVTEVPCQQDESHRMNQCIDSVQEVEETDHQDQVVPTPYHKRFHRYHDGIAIVVIVIAH